jgi:hypothetical protein
MQHSNYFSFPLFQQIATLGDTEYGQQDIIRPYGTAGSIITIYSHAISTNFAAIFLI